MSNAPGAVQRLRAAGLMPRLQASQAVQCTRTFADNIEESDKQLIMKVLRADPVLMDMWQWIKSHDRIDLRIERVNEGMTRVNAPLPDQLAMGRAQQDQIFLRLRRDTATDEATLGTLSHELNLHLLPYARVVMLTEISSEGYPEELKNRASAVLSTIGSDEETLVRNVLADIDNKRTQTWGGNHSDVALWNRHLRTVMQYSALIGDQQARQYFNGQIDRILQRAMLYEQEAQRRRALVQQEETGMQLEHSTL